MVASSSLKRFPPLPCSIPYVSAPLQRQTRAGAQGKDAIGFSTMRLALVAALPALKYLPA